MIYIKTHRKEICHEQDVTKGVKTIRREYLPASWYGSQKQLKKLQRDAFALVRMFGNPTLFITLTANPLWPEIQRDLLPGQVPADRPDVVSRIFRGKMGKFLDRKELANLFDGYAVIYFVATVE